EIEEHAREVRAHDELVAAGPRDAADLLEVAEGDLRPGRRRAEQIRDEAATLGVPQALDPGELEDRLRDVHRADAVRDAAPLGEAARHVEDEGHADQLLEDAV